MKKLLLPIAVLAFTLSSCEKLDEFTEFTMPVRMAVSVPAIPLSGNSTVINVGSFETKLDSILTASNSDIDQIETVFLRSFKLILDDQSSGDLDHFENVAFELNSPSSTVMKVAWKEPVPAATTASIDLEVWDVNLKNLFLSDQVDVNMELSNDGTTDDAQIIRIEADFRVNAKILGV